MNKLIVLNHKMNLQYDEVYEYIDILNKVDTNNNLVICPSSVYLADFVNHSSWSVGCQNLYYEEKGAYTGELSTIQLRSIGVEYAIIGHPERRKYFHEDDIMTNQKLKAALDGNIIPIICITEETEDKITKQLDTIMKDIDHIEFITFAYEPMSMIGTDKTIDIKSIETNINNIHTYLEDKYQTHPSIIYGGSITNENIKKVVNIPNIDGIMIGEKSADLEAIIKIIKEIEK